MDLGIGGKAFCIVGGSVGIGWETAHALMAEGADVAIVARDVGGLAEPLQARAVRAGVRGIALSADIVVPGAAHIAVERARDILGRLDGMAVTTHGEAHSPPFVAMEDGEWERQFNDVLLGPARCVRAIMPMLAAQGDGRIVLTAAYSARSPGPTTTGYSAMKAALINLVKALAKAHGANGVRVNAVCPGFIATARAEERIDALVREGGDRHAAERMLLARAGLAPALGRLGTAREVAEMIVFPAVGPRRLHLGPDREHRRGTDF